VLLKVQNLQKRYKGEGVSALTDISFEIAKGEFVAVLGLSGAGKSTLIRCVNLLVRPTSGKIYWENQEISHLGSEQLMLYRRSIGMVFQSFHLLQRLSTLQNVLVGRLGYVPLWRALSFWFPEHDVQDAYQALKRVGLGSFAGQRADLLSGGQQQRVAIARALMQKPKLILGDEPVASLDPLTSESVMELLKSINQREHITMMINLHDVELAKRYATRIIGISKGRVVYDGPPQKLNSSALDRIYSSSLGGEIA
jgi:phosphonate transport system ATP-binding protein